MTNHPNRNSPQTKFQHAVDKLGLSLSCEFVPWSQSRNKNEKDDRGNARRSLNWRVTLKRDGRDIIITDYSAGGGHCPSYKQPMGRVSQYARAQQDELVELETENGRVAKRLNEHMPPYATSKAIEPSPLDVIHSLVIDAGVLDASSFEEWAGEYGYDIDSRKAEITYRACLDIALKLRNGIGEQGLEALRNASQDY